LTEGEAPGDCLEYQRVAELIDAWPKLRESMPPAAGDAAAQFIDARIGRLRRGLADSGFGDPQAAALASNDEPMVCAEMAAISREALWHASQIAYEALHRWPELALKAEGAAPAAARDWVAMGLKSQATT
jgi:hypothetical protein